MTKIDNFDELKYLVKTVFYLFNDQDGMRSINLKNKQLILMMTFEIAGGWLISNKIYQNFIFHKIYNYIIEITFSDDSL
jgi:hypothetical protein